jgi:putative ATPase
MSQTDLFTSSSPNNSPQKIADKVAPPLASSVRPQHFEDYFGQEEVFKRYPHLKHSKFGSLVFFGPPGCGKTTLARILAEKSGREFYTLSAVLSGVSELKKMIQNMEEMKGFHKSAPLLFIDEIHRYNKVAQDALLPALEEGLFILIGATTENPRSSLNKPLLSRLSLIELKPLKENDLFQILKRACKIQMAEASENSLHFLAGRVSGDARLALNVLDQLLQASEEVNEENLTRHLQENARRYDKNSYRHHDIISAFIKSIRGSDPQAALLYLAVMLDGGEDPAFISRRLIILASEDVGNADPKALSLAVACHQAVTFVGMPEARISLAQATTYLACAPKSNAAYNGINEALAWVASQPSVEVPEYLKQYTTEEEKLKYRYPHTYSNHYVDQSYALAKIPDFYRMTDMGEEKSMRQWIKSLKSR